MRLPPSRLALALTIASVLAACEGAERGPGERAELATIPFERGERLLIAGGCTACHAAQRLPRFEAPRLADVGSRVRPAWLRGFLKEHALGRDDDIEDLVHFLAAQGGPFEESAAEPDMRLLERGRQLYHGIGCVACHAPLEVPEDLDRPLWRFESGWVEGTDAPGGLRPLGHLPAKTSAKALAAFLADPLAVMPDGRMPSLSLTTAEARSLAAYLTTPEVRADTSGFALAPGLRFEYFEDELDELDGPPEVFDEHLPVHRGIAARPGLDVFPHRDEFYGFRFRGFVTVPEDGRYTFHTTSDDGSFLLIDDELVVDNGGDHGMTEREGEIALDAGRHALTITMNNRSGDEGLELAWSGPGFAKEPLPESVLSHWTGAAPRAGAAPGFRPDPSRVTAGGKLFDRFDCAACHPLSGRAAPDMARALSSLDIDDDCPREPSIAERSALAAVQRDPPRLAAPATPAESLRRTFERLDCSACHARDGRGGPARERAPYFRVEGGLDLGDEGRLPPHLDGVGAKLRTAWLDQVLLEGGSVRPYMTTRMPRFGAANVSHLTELFAQVDAAPAFESEPEFDRGRVENGRMLAGTGALGCIQCHNLAGFESTGIPAVDLASTYARIRPGWFRTLLLDPRAVGMNPRMPLFWQDDASPVVDVYGGDPVRQTEALWTRLSLGEAVPLPDGLVVREEEYELRPAYRALMVGVFMKGVSPRTVLVGYPQRLHVAFDVEGSRLAKAWRGRFFNARGTWHGRAGELEVPPSEDLIDFPTGVPFAFLASPDAPWPARRADDLGYRVLGRRIDAVGRPTFRYAIDGLEIEETPIPVLGPAARRSCAASA